MVTKVKDGLFMEDVEAALDAEFIELNKITRVVNCAAGQVTNVFAAHGIRYLSLNWHESGESVIFDAGDMVVKQIKNFIDQALALGECVLVHSLHGNSRAATCTLAYLMYRHWWSLEKAFEYLVAKRPDIGPKEGLVQQLYTLDRRLRAQRLQRAPEYLKARYSGWSPEGLRTLAGDEDDTEEIVLVNTFLNGQHLVDSIPPPALQCPDHKATAVKWADNRRQGPIHASYLEPSEPSRGGLCAHSASATPTNTSGNQAAPGGGPRGKRPVKSILKKTAPCVGSKEAQGDRDAQSAQGECKGSNAWEAQAKGDKEPLGGGGRMADGAGGLKGWDGQMSARRGGRSAYDLEPDVVTITSRQSEALSGADHQHDNETNSIEASSNGSLCFSSDDFADGKLTSMLAGAASKGLAGHRADTLRNKLNRYDSLPLYDDLRATRPDVTPSAAAPPSTSRHPPNNARPAPAASGRASSGKETQNKRAESGDVAKRQGTLGRSSSLPNDSRSLRPPPPSATSSSAAQGPQHAPLSSAALMMLTKTLMRSSSTSKDLGSSSTESMVKQAASGPVRASHQFAPSARVESHQDRWADPLSGTGGSSYMYGARGSDQTAPQKGRKSTSTGVRPSSARDTAVGPPAETVRPHTTAYGSKPTIAAGNNGGISSTYTKPSSTASCVRTYRHGSPAPRRKSSSSSFNTTPSSGPITTAKRPSTTASRSPYYASASMPSSVSGGGGEPTGGGPTAGRRSSTPTQHSGDPAARPGSSTRDAPRRLTGASAFNASSANRPSTTDPRATQQPQQRNAYQSLNGISAGSFSRGPARGTGR